MQKLIASRASVVIAAALFALATWMNASRDVNALPTSFTVLQPVAEEPSLALNR